MKNIILCLIIILSCSCRRDTDNSRSSDPENTFQRRIEINKIMKDHYHSFDNEYEIRGPLTVEQFEMELIELHEESSKIREKVYGVTEKFEDSEIGKDCIRIKKEYTKGDELYFFKSDERSWNNRRGIKGYVLIRTNKMIDGLVTGIN